MIKYVLWFTDSECDNGHYGTDCSTACSCHPGNTESCDKVTGKCNCTNGWTGVNCTKDIDECNDTTNAICPTNSECENLNGTYRCICNDGFSMAEGQCVCKYLFITHTVISYTNN